MAGKYVTTLSSLTLALALGACGGGTSDTEETVVVDPAAPADPAVESAETMTTDEPVVESAETMATDEPAVESAETMATDEPAAAEESVLSADGDGWTTMQGDWENSAGIVKDRWAELTEEEILATGGDREQLVVLVQERYGIERDQAEQEVNDWASAL